MIPAGPTVLLLTSHQHRHRDALVALRRRGQRVRVAIAPQHALRLLDQAPEVVLVDITARDWLSAGLVRRLNRARRASLVLMLHDGSLDDATGEISRLSVDGFCRAGDWRPVAGISAVPASRPALVN